MKKKKYQISLTLAIQIHQMLRFAALILVGIILTKSGFELAQIGEFEGLQFIGAALSVFWLNGFIQGALPYFPTLVGKEKDNFLFQLYTLATFFSLLIFSILIIFDREISYLFTSTQLPLLSLFAYYLVLYLPTHLLEYIYLLRGKSKEILVSSGLTFLALSCSALWVAYTDKSIKTLIFIWIAIGFVRHLALWNLIKFSTDKKHYYLFIQICLPLIAYSFVGQYAVNFDAWLVNYHYVGDAAIFAVFRYGSRELPIFLALATGLSNSMSIEIAAKESDAIQILKKKTLKLLHLCFPFSILLIISSNYWFPVIFSKNFEGSIIIFDIFLLLVISRLLFPQTILLAKQQNKTIFFISLIELFINVVFSVVGIHYFGLAGVAFGTFIAFLAEKLILAFWLEKKFNIAFSEYTPTYIWILYSFVLLVIFILKYWK